MNYENLIKSQFGNISVSAIGLSPNEQKHDLAILKAEKISSPFKIQ